MIINCNSITGSDRSTECLLIHAGTPTLACGLFTIYNYLSNVNIKCCLLKIYMKTPEQIVKTLLQYNNLKLVGISMHWHPQIAISIKLAELVKVLPNCKGVKIAMGGITAGYFAADLIKLPMIDFVIKGDGEVPLSLLFKIIKSGDAKVNTIPNLYYKENGVVKRSKKKYYSTPKIINDMEMQAIESRLPLREIRNVLNPGRGCNQDCIYCGGSRQAFYQWSNRTSMLKRTKCDLSLSVEKLMLLKKPSIYFANDADGKCSIISKCLSEFDLSKFEHVTIDAWGLPSFNNIIKIFEKSDFKRKISFLLEISPETGSDEIRKKVKGFFFSNRKLESFISNYFEKYPNFKLNLFFSYFLPSSEEDSLTTREYICKISEKHHEQIIENKLRIFLLPLSTDPGSKIQKGLVKNLKSDVVNIMDYNSKLLKNFNNIGNFLYHRPLTIKKMDLDFICEFHRFENIVRMDHPSLYLNIIALFNDFYDYNFFIKKQFKKFYINHIKIYKTGLFSLTDLDISNSFFGYHFITDEISPSKKQKILWLSFLKDAINRRNFIKYKKINKQVGSESVNELDYRILLKKFKLLQIREYIEIVITQEIFINAMDNDKKMFYQDILEGNSMKIETLKNNEISYLYLMPVKNIICEVKSIRNLNMILSHICENDNLRLLGYEYLQKIIQGIDLQRATSGIVSEKKRLKLRNDIIKIKQNFSKYWSLISKGGNKPLINKISEIIIKNYIPIQEIMKQLNRGEKNTTYKCDNIQYNKNKLSVRNMYGKFSRCCDIRILNFFLNHLNSTKEIGREKDDKYILLSMFYPDARKPKNPILIKEKISPIEFEILELCNGKNKICDIYSEIRKKKKEYDIFENKIKDIFILFYSKQIVF